jgi:hypothetical protein
VVATNSRIAVIAAMKLATHEIVTYTDHSPPKEAQGNR